MDPDPFPPTESAVRLGKEQEKLGWEEQEDLEHFH